MRRSILFLFILLSSSCFLHAKKKTIGFASKDNNVCKMLKGKVILYPIFVDSKYTKPWSSYDILSAVDSINKAARWIEKKAKEESVSLNILVTPHKSKDIYPIVQNLPGKDVYHSLFRIPMGFAKTTAWANKVCKTASTALPRDTSKITRSKNKLSDRERFIARIRDIHQTDNVALMLFVNNYYSDDVSVSMYTESDSEIEFAIVSYKQPAIIAHEFLHLFGAYDLYISPFDKSRKNNKRKAQAMKYFPNEIMAFAFRSIDSLSISPVTKYLIGWSSTMETEYQKLLLGRKWKALEY